MPMFNLETMLVIARAAALVLSLLALAMALRRWRRSAERDAQRIFEQLDLVRGELMLLAERMDRIESIPARAIERPAASEARAPAVASSPAPRGYEVAARLARGGATCEELISSCGLSRHEAELMLRLHKAAATRDKAEQSTMNKPQQKAGEERRARLSVVG